MTFDGAREITSGAYDWTGRRALVTGGAGFVGSYLVEDLLAQGAEVRVVDDMSTGSSENLAHLSEVEVIEGDLCDPDVVRSSVAGMDVVLHLAARAYGMLRSMDNNPEMLRDNSLMALHVLDACVDAYAQLYDLMLAQPPLPAEEIAPLTALPVLLEYDRLRHPAPWLRPNPWAKGARAHSSVG